MFFGQKIHPLNFDVPDTLIVESDKVELAGPGVRLGVRTADIFPGCLRLRFANAAVGDPRQHSDAVLPEWRAGRPVAPRLEAETAVFVAEAGRIELGAATLRLELAGFALTTVAAGVGACGEALLLDFAI
ncbi:MAG: hypothetical protein MUC53_11965, partial [Candidatus Contendobacter sp.]|nr:hypothetical protein [Candidatus Contendobacter sp.]